MKTSKQFILITLGFMLSPFMAFYVHPFAALALFALCAIKIALIFMEDL
jgi:hypothetical protein